MIGFDWTRISDRRGRHSYRAEGYGIKRGAWKMRGKAVTMNRASYATTYTMKGWAIYDGPRYVTRRRTLELAKATAEAHSRLGRIGRRKLVSL